MFLAGLSVLPHSPILVSHFLGPSSLPNPYKLCPSAFPIRPFQLPLYPHRSWPGHKSPTTYNCGPINSTITGKNLVLQKPQPKRSNTHYLVTLRSLPMSSPNFILKTLPDLGISSATLTVPSQFRITHPPCSNLDADGITRHWFPTTEKAHLHVWHAQATVSQ